MSRLTRVIRMTAAVPHLHQLNQSLLFLLFLSDRGAFDPQTDEEANMFSERF